MEDKAMVAILVLLTIIVCLTMDYMAERATLRRVARAGLAGAPEVPAPPFAAILAEDLSRLPAGIFVGPGHAWLELLPEGSVRVGADRLPAALLGGLDAVATVPAGAEVREGERLAVLRRGERSIEVKSPVGGVITEVNPAASADPESLGREPYGSGWLVRMTPARLSAALRRLSVAEEARSFLREQLAELREVLVGLAFAGRAAGEATPVAALPDGGLPVDGVAGRLSAEQWQEVVRRFF